MSEPYYIQWSRHVVEEVELEERRDSEQGMSNISNMMTIKLNQTLSALSIETENSIITSIISLLKLRNECYASLVLYLGRLMVRLYEEGVGNGTLEEGMAMVINRYIKLMDNCIAIEPCILKVLCVTSWRRYPFLMPLLTTNDTVSGTIIPARTWNRMVDEYFKYDVNRGTISNLKPLEVIAKAKKGELHKSKALLTSIQKMEDNLKNVSFRYSYIIGRYNKEAVIALIQRLVALYRNEYDVGVVIVYSSLALLYIMKDGPRPTKGVINLLEFIIAQMQLNSMDRSNLRRVVNQMKAKWGY